LKRQTPADPAAPASAKQKKRARPAFPLRLRRISGSRRCQFIRGQHRVGKVEGIIPRAPGCNRRLLMPVLLRAYLDFEDDKGMTNKRHFCEEIAAPFTI